MATTKASPVQTIRMQILDCKIQKFELVDLENIDYDIDAIQDWEFAIKVDTGTNRENKLIKINLEIKGFLEAEKESIFHIGSSSVFKVPEIDKVIGENEALDGPRDFIVKLLNICIGGIRGMLAVKLMNTKLHNITLPLIDVSSLFKNQEEENEV